MSEHDEFGAAGTEDGNADEADVEAHGLREVAVTGLSAAALIAGAGAGAGDALAANAPQHTSAAAKQAVHKIDAANKGAAISKGSISKESVNKGATFKGAAISKGSISNESVNKGATFKGNAASKFAVSKFAVSKEAVDPSSRRGRNAS